MLRASYTHANETIETILTAGLLGAMGPRSVIMKPPLDSQQWRNILLLKACETDVLFHKPVLENWTAA